MAIIKAFKAYRPIEELASKIAALPYDVMNTEEAREMAKGNKYSFLYVDRGEINFPEKVNIYGEEVCKESREVLDKMIENKYYFQDKNPYFYIYRQTMNGKSQVGLVVCASVDDYINNVIKKHEKTRADKELDRINHVDYCDAHTGPIFLTYRENNDISKIINESIKEKPVYDFISDDGNGHTVWVISNKEKIDKLIRLFNDVNYMYIADGHHRIKSAVEVCLKRRRKNPNYTGKEGFNYFLAIAYPDSELDVLDYNRTVKDLNGLSKEEFLKAIQKKFIIEKTPNNERFKPNEKHTFGMYIDNEWFKLKAREGTFDKNDPTDRLDVSILQNNLLSPILGIDDPTKSDRIEFIGGIRGLRELEKRANTDMRVSFAMYPTTIEDIMSIADAGKIMPPKSTWFEPKPRSGLFIHKLTEIHE